MLPSSPGSVLSPKGALGLVLVLGLTSCRQCGSHAAQESPGFCLERWSEGASSSGSHIVEEQAVGLKPKAIGSLTLLWSHRLDQPLKLMVRFLDGTEFQKSSVELYAPGWTDATEGKVQFAFTDDPKVHSDIRVTFHSAGSSSIVGFDPAGDQQDTTMWFGWVDEQHSNDQIKSVILHEFGHALGLFHEHQHPDAGIPWDTAAVYKYFLSRNPDWDSATVDLCVFRRYDSTTSNSDVYDPLSIMHYPIPDTLTRGRFHSELNTRLSQVDKRFITQTYRWGPCGKGTPCCADHNGNIYDCALDTLFQLGPADQRRTGAR